MRAIAAPRSPAEEQPLGRVVLKDGSVTTLRAAHPDDLSALQDFFHRLSAESRYQRFFTSGEAKPQLLARLCEAADGKQGLTLLASHTRADGSDIIGVGSYVRIDDRTAEVAFAVDDEFQGRGIATALLEHLGVEAARHGFRTFRALTLGDNLAMLDVFARCGFEVHSRSDRDGVEIDLSIAPTATSVRAAEARAHAASVASIRPLLRPGAIAVVGASRTSTAIGRRVLDAIVASGYQGRLYPVHPSASRIAELEAFRSVRDIPGPIDLAVIAVPRASVLQVVDDCAAAGVRTLVVLTAGFAEAGDEGRALQQRLVDTVRGHGMRMVGPNCMGIVNAGAGSRLNASFSPVFPPAGRLALSSQSGALGIVILALAAARQVGLSSFVSIGNKADVSSNDLLEYWESDPDTAVIALYLESFGNPRRFARLARRIGRAKPIIAVKGGRTRAGSRAASSHTAALAASDTAVAALFHQTGVIRADTIDEMFDLAACLDAQPLPAGRRVAIVTNAGGPGILAADACEAAGLSVVDLSDATRARIAKVLPDIAQAGNPVDLIASAGPDEYRSVIESLLAADDTDALIILYTPVDSTHADAILAGIRDGIAAGRAGAPARKPVLACLMPAADQPVLLAGAERIPVYAFPENAARALGKITTYAAWRAAPPGVHWTFDDIVPDEAQALCRSVIAARGSTWLTSEETWRVLNAFGITLTVADLVRTADQAASVAGAMGFPVVAKLASKDALHKSDVGGVKVNLQNAHDVRAAFDALMAAANATGLAAEGVWVQPMIVGGTETMIGVVQDRLFGALVGLGRGGTDVEILDDVRFRVAPLSDRDADELIAGTRAFTLMSGYRGRPSGDLPTLTDLLLRVSCLADTVPEILELDLNPVIVLPAGEGCQIVDARIRVGAPARPRG